MLKQNETMTSLSFLRRMSLHKIRKPVAKDAAVAEPQSIRQQAQQPGQPEYDVPEIQTVLLLRAPRQSYQLSHDHPVPRVQGDSELLVKSRAIGLNPIDWKSPYVSSLSTRGFFYAICPSDKLPTVTLVLPSPNFPTSPAENWLAMLFKGLGGRPVSTLAIG